MNWSTGHDATKIHPTDDKLKLCVNNEGKFELAYWVLSPNGGADPRPIWINQNGRLAQNVVKYWDLPEEIKELEMKTEELPGITLATDGRCLMVTGENNHKVASDYEDIRTAIPIKKIRSYSSARGRGQSVWTVWVECEGIESFSLTCFTEGHANQAMDFIRRSFWELDC